MLTEAEIKTEYKELHDLLTELYYSGLSELTKEEFDQLHGDNWDTMRQELILYGYLFEPTPPLVFQPSNPSHDPPTRIEHIEDFLRRAYP